MKTLFSVAALFLATTLSAQLTFTPNTIDSGNTASSSHTMSPGDFDGDGDTDLFGATMGGFPIDGTFNLYLNDGSGNFTLKVIENDPNLSEGARELKTIDVDGDLDLDVVACAFQSDTFLWFENDGNANFTTHLIDDTVSITEEPDAVDAGDLDGDGDIDIVGVTFTGHALVIYENDGSQNFGNAIILAQGTSNPISHGLADVHVVDLNQDGSLDLISAADYGDTYAWWENDGSGNFTSHIIEQGGNVGDVANAAQDVVAVDLDNDGDIDITAASFSGYFLWFENDGAENFTTHVIDNSTFTEAARRVSPIDLDRDGDIDILTSALGNDTFAWYENDGSQNFTPNLITNDPDIADVPTYINAIDIAGDCEPEIVIAAIRADAFTYFDVSGIPSPSNLVVAPKVYLQGAGTQPYIGEETLMRDDLRGASQLPLVSPYTDGARTTSSVLATTGANAIVDWVWVELRDASNRSTLRVGKSALLQRDGDVVDIDGVSRVIFCGSPSDYHVAVHHRNHIPIVTNTPITLSSTVTGIDFTMDNTVAFGGNLAVTDLGNGIFAMYAGDLDRNGQVQNTDFSELVLQIGLAGYSASDLDMNGQTQNTDITNLLNPNIGIGKQF